MIFGYYSDKRDRKKTSLLKVNDGMYQYGCQ